MRFVKVPLRRSNIVRPLQEQSSLGRQLPSCQHVPPMPFLTTTTVYSAQRPAGLLHPAADHRVRLVWTRFGEPKPSVPGFPPERRCTPRSVSLPASRSAITHPRQADCASLTDRPLTPLLQCLAACCHTVRPPSLDLRVLIRQKVRCSPVPLLTLESPMLPGLMA
jgi:hypothetical protein